MTKKTKTRTLNKLKSMIAIIKNGNLEETQLWQLLGMSQRVSAAFENELKDLDRIKG